MSENVYYEIIPEFNSGGRLCNHGGILSESENERVEKVKVRPDELERFSQMAGRQHKIVDGWVVFDETLEPCMPDAHDSPATTEETLAGLIFELVDKGVL